MFLRLVLQYWYLSLMRLSPAETPYSPPLSLLIALIFTLVVVSQWLMVDLKPPFSLETAILAAISLCFSYALYSWGLLRFKHKQSRSLQTVTSLWASHSLIHCFAYPMLLASPALLDMGASLFGLMIGLSFLFITLVLSIWQFMVTVFIYRSALNCSVGYGVMAAVGLLAVNVLMVSFWR